VVADVGSVTLTAGQIPVGLRGAAGGALVNAGLAAFVPAAAAELPRGLRLNAVSPGWVAESLAAIGEDPAGGTPVDVVAAAYVGLVEGTATGTVVTPG
jgi:NAD(P)-dependent dehydrogenase (short-subunit alcohol dehydrogenase family)